MEKHTSIEGVPYQEREARAQILLRKLKEHIFISQGKRVNEEKSRFDYYLHPRNGLSGSALATDDTNGNNNDKDGKGHQLQRKGRAIEHYLRALLIKLEDRSTNASDGERSKNKSEAEESTSVDQLNRVNLFRQNSKREAVKSFDILYTGKEPGQRDTRNLVIRVLRCNALFVVFTLSYLHINDMYTLGTSVSVILEGLRCVEFSYSFYVIA